MMFPAVQNNKTSSLKVLTLAAKALMFENFVCYSAAPKYFDVSRLVYHIHVQGEVGRTGLQEAKWSKCTFIRCEESSTERRVFIGHEILVTDSRVESHEHYVIDNTRHYY